MGESKDKVWNDKRKMWTNPASQTGYIGPTVREVFSNLKGEAQSTPIFRDAYKKVRSYIALFEKGSFKDEEINKRGRKRV